MPYVNRASRGPSRSILIAYRPSGDFRRLGTIPGTGRLPFENDVTAARTKKISGGPLLRRCLLFRPEVGEGRFRAPSEKSNAIAPLFPSKNSLVRMIGNGFLKPPSCPLIVPSCLKQEYRIVVRKLPERPAVSSPVTGQSPGLGYAIPLTQPGNEATDSKHIGKCGRSVHNPVCEVSDYRVGSPQGGILIPERSEEFHCSAGRLLKRRFYRGKRPG